MENDVLNIRDLKEKIQTECEIEYVRSSGPGGQNVNKLATKAQLRWKVLESQCFDAEQKEQIMLHLQHRINKQQYVFFQSDRFRSQEKNEKDCLAKLYQALIKALTKKKHRFKTKPSRSQIQSRLDEKKRQSGKKQDRQKKWVES